MIYLTLFTTSEGDLFSGISTQPDDYTLPANCVDVADLTIPAVVVALGITDWPAFNESGLLNFYRYDGTSTLVLRSLDYYYYSVPGGALFYKFTGSSTVSFSENSQQSNFVTTEYAGSEETPLVLYAEEDGVIYNGLTYSATQRLVIYEWPYPPIPTGFTTTQPLGSLSAYDTWQWNGTSWIAAPFPITYTLAQAQEYLTSLVNANGAALVNNQLRNYSLPELFAAADVNALLPADSVSNLYPTIGDYQVAVDAETAPLLADITSATAVNQLYVFDPTVNEPAPYAP